MIKGATMYKNLIIVAFVFCLTSSIANAQTEKSKPMICFPAAQIFSELKEIGEEPVWTGQSLANDSFYVLTVNSKTKEWTLLQSDDKTACIIGIGKTSKFYFKRI